MSENINVKKLRTSLKISQADFAKLLGVTQKTVSNWEAGKVIPKSKIEMLQNLGNNATIKSNNYTKLPYDSNTLDGLKKQIEDMERTIEEYKRLVTEKEEIIKEKDSQIKILINILNK